MIKFLIYALLIGCIGYVAADTGTAFVKKNTVRMLDGEAENRGQLSDN